jgi:flagellar biogenesis protein FliO
MFEDWSLPLRFLVAFLIVLALIGATAWVVRRFGADRLGASAARGRQPRLAVIDAAAVDGRRRLVLIRRDNVEHLLMIGGPTDVVVELNIVRGATAAREAVPREAPGRAPEPAPRAAAASDTGMWPLQPEPALPTPRQRMPMPEESTGWQAEPEPPPLPLPLSQRRSARQADPLAGLAAELSRTPELSRPTTLEPIAPAPREREPARSREPQPAPSITDPQYAANADQNLAEMARHLEAALRRPPGKGGDVRPEAKAPGEPEAESDGTESQPQAKPGRAEPKPQPKAQKSVYDSLEQEMASLLGRPNSKT